MSAPLHLDGAALTWHWALPFAGILLCIATGPVFFPHRWEPCWSRFRCSWCSILPLSHRR
jgi:hypothetical protein